MSRIRTVKPEFFLDEELAQHPPLERLLFEGLWCLADRDGRLEDRPSRIKAQILPYDDCDVEGMLASLAADGFIERYEVRGRHLISVPAFGRHQRPNHREPPSTLPGPGEARPGTPGRAQPYFPGSLDQSPAAVPPHVLEDDGSSEAEHDGLREVAETVGVDARTGTPGQTRAHPGTPVWKGREGKGITTPPDPPAGAGGLSHDEPAPRNRGGAIERLIERASVGGLTLTVAEVRQLKRRLKAGASEGVLAAEVDAEIARDHAHREGERRTRAAVAWIQQHGGPEVVALGLLDWLERNRKPGESVHEARDRWLAEVPPHVFALIGPALHAAEKKRAATIHSPPMSLPS